MRFALLMRKMNFEKIWKISIGYFLGYLIISGLFEALFNIDWKWGILIWSIFVIFDSVTKTYYIYKWIEWISGKLNSL